MSFYHSSAKVFANIRIHGIKNHNVKIDHYNHNFTDNNINVNANADDNADDNTSSKWSPRWITVEVKLYLYLM